MTVVLATSSTLPALDVDDQRLYQALQQANVPAEIAVWDDPSVDWRRFELCVIRSTWDYVPKRQQFVEWAHRVASQTVLWNPAPLIEWNTTKSYLRDMETQGIPIVDTEWLTQGTATDFLGLFQQRGWDDVVIKPVISASGKDTFRVTPGTFADQQADIEVLLTQRDLMMQPFMRSVLTTGELSLLFFNGTFSHALSKIPAQHEFRVHEHLGGTTRRYQPTDEQLAFAQRVFNKLPWPTLYARVDLLLDETGNIRLTELELTEPSMYLAYDPDSPARFAQAIQARLENR